MTPVRVLVVDDEKPARDRMLADIDLSLVAIADIRF